MSWIDWLVLGITLVSIVWYGSWKTRKNVSLESYLKGNNEDNWYTIGLSIMATQASAITFLSATGQGFGSGMGFVQFYFGLPLAMIFISIFFLPIYYRLKVYTAYEYLENRFDYRIRAFTAFLFLVSRGLAAGITIYAPAIILSSLFDWNLKLTCVGIGFLVIIYTVSGGSRAVSLTQKWQMGLIMTGMFVAFYYILEAIPESYSFTDTVNLAGDLGKMQVVNYEFDIKEKYNIWAGLTGGFFLALSYFGTDQSQVQRYLGGKSLRESRLGLMFNGIFKIPMQFFIVFTGVMLFIAYQFNAPPIIYNDSGIPKEILANPKLVELEEQHHRVFEEKKEVLAISYKLVNNEKTMFEVQELQAQQEKLKKQYQTTLTTLYPDYNHKDGDYVFLTFVLKYLPNGLIGLLLAVILSAAMSSTASELNALASTTTIDFYKKYFTKGKPENEVRTSRLITVAWGITAIFVALVAGLFENLIELVNILGSLFYGTILGVFLVAFFFKKVGAKSVLIGAVIAEISILSLFTVSRFSTSFEIGYLWYNLIGSLIVIFISLIIQQLKNN
jgi:SSS family solute:Na+ symporter